jgi:CheY-like chemotaxis protein
MKILVVDDFRDMREMLAEVLRAASYTVETAADGAEALDKLRDFAPDLVLLDLFMPHTDGWAFLEAQQADPRLAAIPVVVMSASHDAATSVARRYRVWSYLTKPFGLRRLFRAIEQRRDTTQAQERGSVDLRQPADEPC